MNDVVGALPSMSYGLPLRGTAGMLVEARRRGLIGNIRSGQPFLSALNSEFGGHLTEFAEKPTGLQGLDHRLDNYRNHEALTDVADGLRFAVYGLRY